MALPKNASVVFRNLADAATVTASTSVTATPATRVQNPHVGIKWRSTANTATLDFDFGSGGVSLDSVSVHGLTATGCRFYLDEDDATFSSPDEDSGAITVDQDYRQAAWLLDAPVTRRYLRVSLSHSTLGYVEAGRVVAGLRDTFTYNYDYGWSITTVDPSPRSQTLGGQTRIELRPLFRLAELNFGWIAEDDRYGFVEAMERYAALRREVLVLLNPDSANLPRDTILGLIEDASPIVQPFLDIFSKSYRFRERL